MRRPVTGMRAFTSIERRAIRAELLDKYGPYCQICINLGSTQHVAEIDFSQQRNEKKAFSIDHIIALADGGSNTIDNMWPAHAGCNSRKGSEHAARKRELTASRYVR